jgi:hypothetical protein
MSVEDDALGREGDRHASARISTSTTSAAAGPAAEPVAKANVQRPRRQAQHAYEEDRAENSRTGSTEDQGDRDDARTARID